MPNPAVGLIVGGSSLAGAGIQAYSGRKAASAQMSAAKQGRDEQARQFDALQALLKPYVDAGTPALRAQQNLIGLGGVDAQQQAIAGIEQSPMFQSIVQQGEQGMLQNASATGGLRGGNLQGALAQFRPQLLNQLIEQQYSRLGGLTSLGQNAAAGVGNAGMGYASNVGNLLAQGGAAKAGAILAGGQAFGNVMNLPAQFSMLDYARGGSGNPFGSWNQDGTIKAAGQIF